MVIMVKAARLRLLRSCDGLRATTLLNVIFHGNIPIMRMSKVVMDIGYIFHILLIPLFLHKPLL